MGTFSSCMFCTRDYVLGMAMIQIRNVPEAVHRRLKARAAMAGVSLSDMLLREATALAETPTVGELRARLAALTPAGPGESAAEAARAEREAR